MFDSLSGFPILTLFLKATQKKQVWIPQFTKKNGQVVGGHYAHVHVTDDHSHAKVAAGQGSYSQKKAHAKLAKEEGDAFHDLSVDDKAALVMHHATQIQDEESMTARLATLKKKVLAGEKALGSELKAYHAAPHEKKIKLLQAAQESGKLGAFDAQYAAWLTANPDQAKEATTEAAPPAAQEPEAAAPASEPKDEPKPAPAPAEPAVEAKPAPAAEPAPAAPEVKLPAGAPKKPNIIGSLAAKQVADKIEAAMAAGDHAALDDAMGDVPMASDKLKWQKIKAYAGEASKFIDAQKVPAKAEPVAAAAPEQAPAKHFGEQNEGKLFQSDSGKILFKFTDGAWQHQKEGKQWETLSPGLVQTKASLDVGMFAGKDLVAGPKEGDTKEGEGGTLVLKDGHWVLQAEKPKAPRIKSAKANTADETKLKLKAAISGAKVPSENTNAKSFNPKVDAILAALDAGDAKALLAMSFGTNTYGKKAAKLANEALAHLGSKYMVMAGQKGGQHEGLKMRVTSIKPAEAAPALQPVADGSSTNKMGNLQLPGKMDESFPLVNLAYTLKELSKQHSEAPVSMWIDADDTAAFDALSPDDKIHYANAVMGWNPVAKENMLKWLEWKQSQGAAAPAQEPAKPADAAWPAMPTSESPIIQITLLNATDAAKKGDLASVQSMKDMLPASAEKSHAYIDAVVQAMKAEGVAQSLFTVSVLKQKLAVAVDSAEAKSICDAYVATHGTAKSKDEAVQAASSIGFTGVAGELDAMPDPAKSVEKGPKDGDTMQGADGMLIFMDGRWHKMGEDGKPVKKLSPEQVVDAINAIPFPKLAGTNSKKYAAIMKELKATALAGGAEELAKKAKLSQPTGKNMNVVGAGYKFAISTDPTQASENGTKVLAYVKALQGAVAGQKAPGVTAEPAPAKAAPKVKMPTPAVSVGGLKTEKVGELHALVADGWKQVGPQAGSNPGGLFEDEKGNKWYCKFPSDGEAVKNELLAAKFYQMLGVDVPNLRLVKQNGKLGIASGWVDGVQKADAGTLAAADGAHKGFIFDAWLSNWDVVGLSNDNLMVKDGKAVRIDVGGSLLYRAMGGKKGAAFGNDVPELSTLRDPSKNTKAAAVFSSVTDAHIAAGVAQLNKLKPSQIEELVLKAGPGTEAERKALAATLIARRAFILSEYKARDQWNKKPVDEAKVKVNAADIPGGIDFFHHPDKGGQPLSSKEWLNKQNTADSAALAEFAKQGNLKALKDYHYQAVDSHGNPAGMKPITSHPSNHIQKQWASLVQTLQSVAYPPAETLEMPSFGFGGSLAEMAQEVGAFAPHENVTTVPAEHRLGYFMSLAKLDDEAVVEYAKETPGVFQKVGGDFDKAGKANYQKTSKLVKNYISGVQSSGSINHIWSQGKTDSGLGVSTQELTKAIYEDAQEMPEGTTLLRWMDDDTAADIMTKQLKECSPGVVLQNTDSMCTSYNEGWGSSVHFCGEPKKAILMRIRCAKGAKATPSHGTGGYSSENEITTLPGQRFVIVSVTQGDSKHPDGIVVDCIMLPPDEGYVAQLSNPSPLNKSEQWSDTECLTKSQPVRQKVIVFRLTPSLSRASVTSAIRQS